MFGSLYNPHFSIFHSSAIRKVNSFNTLCFGFYSTTSPRSILRLQSLHVFFVACCLLRPVPMDLFCQHYAQSKGGFPVYLIPGGQRHVLGLNFASFFSTLNPPQAFSSVIRILSISPSERVTDCYLSPCTRSWSTQRETVVKNIFAKIHTFQNKFCAAY